MQMREDVFVSVCVAVPQKRARGDLYWAWNKEIFPSAGHNELRNSSVRVVCAFCAD